MKNLSLRVKILMGTGIPLALLVVLGVVSYNSINKLHDTTAQVEHTYDVISYAELLLESAVDMETGMRGFLLAGKEAFLDPYNHGSVQF